MLAAAVVVLVAAMTTSAPALALPVLKLTKFGAFTAPVAVAQPPGAATDVWVVQKGGQIIVVRNGVRLPTKALDVTAMVTRCPPFS